MDSRFMWLPLWLENILWFQDFSWQVPCLTQSWPTRHHAAVLQGSKCQRDPLPANSADCDVLADRLPVPAYPKRIRDEEQNCCAALSKLARWFIQDMFFKDHQRSFNPSTETKHSRLNRLTSAETLGGPTSSHPARPVKPWPMWFSPGGQIVRVCQNGIILCVMLYIVVLPVLLLMLNYVSIYIIK